VISSAEGNSISELEGGGLFAGEGKGDQKDGRQAGGLLFGGEDPRGIEMGCLSKDIWECQTMGKTKSTDKFMSKSASAELPSETAEKEVATERRTSRGETEQSDNTVGRIYQGKKRGG